MNTYLIVALLALFALIAACVGMAIWKRAQGRVNWCNAANTPNQGTHGDGRMTFLCGESDDWATFAAAYTANASSPKYALVKAGADAQHVRISAGATDQVIGVCTDFADADEDPINVCLFGATKGTVLVVAAAAITQWAYVQSNGDGAVKTAVSTGYVIGRAVQAAGAAGDVIEIIPMVNELAKA